MNLFNVVFLTLLLFAFNLAGAEEKPNVNTVSLDLFGRESPKEYFLEQKYTLDSKYYPYGWLERAGYYQEELGSRVAELGNAIDRIFSDDDYFQNSQGSRLEIHFPLIYDDNQRSIELSPRIRTKLPLPNTNKRLNLILDSTKNSLTGMADPAKGEEFSSISKLSDDELNLVLRGNLIKNNWYRLSLDIGGGFDAINPNPMIGMRLNVNLPSSQRHSNRLIPKIYWKRFSGEVFDAQYRHDWLLSKNKILRFNTGTTWWNRDAYWHIYQAVTYYDKVNTHRVFSYSLRGDWDTENKGLINSGYGIGFSWRERIYKNWMFTSLSPHLFYENNLTAGKYILKPTITLSVEIHFYDLN